MLYVLKVLSIYIVYKVYLQYNLHCILTGVHNKHTLYLYKHVIIYTHIYTTDVPVLMKYKSVQSYQGSLGWIPGTFFHFWYISHHPYHLSFKIKQYFLPSCRLFCEILVNSGIKYKDLLICSFHRLCKYSVRKTLNKIINQYFKAYL